MCSELTPRAHVPDNRIPQLMQPWLMGPQWFLGWYHMFSAVFRCFPMFSAVLWCSQLFYDVLSCFMMVSAIFRIVFSWDATFMHNHRLCWHFFSWWCQMFSDNPEMFSGFPEMFSDVLSCFQMFSGCPKLITDILYRFSDLFKICSIVLKYSQMFSDDH